MRYNGSISLITVILWLLLFWDPPRLELCECSLTAGNYLLSQTDTNCGHMPEARDGYFTTYYAFNKIILDIITVKFNIQVDDRTITQSTLLHDDIPGYNL